MPSTHPWQQPRVMRGIVSPCILGPGFWALLTAALLSYLLGLWLEVKAILKPKVSRCLKVGETTCLTKWKAPNKQVTIGPICSFSSGRQSASPTGADISSPSQARLGCFNATMRGWDKALVS